MSVVNKKNSFNYFNNSLSSFLKNALLLPVPQKNLNAATIKIYC